MKGLPMVAEPVDLAVHFIEMFGRPEVLGGTGTWHLVSWCQLA
jgi:hypothetical protein